MEKPHKRLEVWKNAMDIAERIYSVTAAFPDSERYSLTAQMRRSAVSIPSNIAEGAARNTKKEFSNFLHIAQGSLSELDTQLELAMRLGYIQTEHWNEMQEKMISTDKMLTGLIKVQ